MAGTPPCRRDGRTRRSIARLLTLGMAGAALTVPFHQAPPAAANTDPPSVVLILTDDQRWDTLDRMPIVNAELVAKGTTFSNAFVSNSLCCPSRSSLLTGRYSHSTGVWRNQPPYGGWASFDDTTTIATELDAAGYTTGLFGKYLNGYWDGADLGYVPPGWDSWGAFSHSAYYDYEISVDGVLEPHGGAPADYSTDVLAAKSTSFIRNAAGPLFLYFAPFAPHGPATPGPGHGKEFSNLRPWRPASYNEADMSDKPGWTADLKRWDDAKKASKDERRLNQYRTLRSVDAAVGEIVQALADTGRLQNTMIVFMSDNGLAWGEHRWSSKIVPYEEAIRVPMVIRYDALGLPSRTEDRMALNIDLTPTFYEAAGIPGAWVDGSSLMPLLTDSAVAWRDDFLLEHLQKVRGRVPTYCGVRTTSYAYVVYGTGDEELYDLATDPGELQNVVADPAFVHIRDALRARVVTLCDPVPPGFTFPW